MRDAYYRIKAGRDAGRVARCDGSDEDHAKGQHMLVIVIGHFGMYTPFAFGDVEDSEPPPKCPRCGYVIEGEHIFRMTAYGCYAGAEGDILVALEGPTNKKHRAAVAEMIREGLGMCLEPRCGSERYQWGPNSGYCVRHEPERAPESAVERRELEQANAATRA